MWPIGIPGGGYGQLYPAGATILPPLDVPYLAGYLIEKGVLADVLESQGLELDLDHLVAHGDLVSWAIYFCRYSRYMLPLKEALVDDFAADNASYKRSILDRYQTVRERLLGIGGACADESGRTGVAFDADRCRLSSQILLVLGFYRTAFSSRQAIWCGACSSTILGPTPSAHLYIAMSLPSLSVFLISYAMREFVGYLIGPEPG